MGTGTRIVIISDTHLGRPGHGAGSAASLRPLWQDADELIINGDAAELADPVQRGAAARAILNLQDLTEADGVRLTLLAGNHDPLINDRRFLRLSQGSILLTHGDLLHPAISPWTEHAHDLRRLQADALAALRRHDPAADPNSPAARAAIAAHAASVEWDHRLTRPHTARPTGTRRVITLAHKCARVAWYWHQLPKLAKAFARLHSPQSQFFIFGHIHRAGMWTDTQPPAPGVAAHRRVLINTGSYHYPRNPRAVVVTDTRLAVHKVKTITTDQGPEHHLKPRPLATFALPQAQPQTHPLAA